MKPKYLLYTLLFLFPLANLGRIELGGGVNFTINDIAVLVFVKLFFLYKIFKHQKIIFPKHTKEILLFIFVAFVSLLIGSRNLTTTQTIVSALYLARFIIYGLIYLVVYNLTLEKQIQEKFVHKILLILGVIISLLGLFQYIVYPDLGNLSYLGWDPHQYRVFVPFFDPIFTGAILVLSLIIWMNYKERINRNLYGLAGFSIYSALMLTYSRAAYLMLITAIICTSYFKKSWKFLFIGVLLMFCTILILPNRSYGNNIQREETLASRIKNWSNAITIIKKNFILGVGFDSYRYAQLKEGFLGEDWETNHAGAGVDNSFLFIFATTGFIGLIIFLILVKNMVLDNLIHPILLTSFISLIVFSFTANALFYTFIMEWMWILLGISEVKKAKKT